MLSALWGNILYFYWIINERLQLPFCFIDYRLYGTYLMINRNRGTPMHMGWRLGQ